MEYKNMCRLFVLAASVFIVSTSFAKSPVYKVTKGDNQLFIGGTVHLLSSNDYPLPAGFSQAFQVSERVFFEADVSQMSVPENQVKMAAIMTLEGAKTLEGELTGQTYARLERFLTERQIPIAGFSQLTPAAISITLSLIEMQRLGLGNPQSGVDQFFEVKALEAEMPRDYLETVDAQIGFLNEFNRAEPNAVINASLDDIDSLQKNWKLALNAWRTGDLDSMAQSLGADKLKTQFPAIYKVLLTDRNTRWMAQIKPMFETKEVEFILVGALHLVEGNGLIQQLQSDGYTVQQLD